MRNVSDVDKNFNVETKLEKDGLKFYNCLDKPFETYGVYMENGKFRRLPESVAKSVSAGVLELHTHTAGGRVRFRTDSPFVAINVKMPFVAKMAHFPVAGSAGFDAYVNFGDGEEYLKTFMPSVEMTDGYESLLPIDREGMCDVTINFPLYSEVSELYIGLHENAKVEAPTPYADKKPVVYYGSSITQGGCASRPGNCYQGYISRRFNCDYINLGFSGSAKAEDNMTDYIKGLDMSMFVYDYDHNAPSVEYLRNTHEKMFKAIREKHPDIPVVMMTAPIWEPKNGWDERRDIVGQTYRNALAAGDKNVYFIDGKTLMAVCENNGTVDNCHPTDLGFFSMAKALGDTIEKIWG